MEFKGLIQVDLVEIIDVFDATNVPKIGSSRMKNSLHYLAYTELLEC